MSFTPFQPFRAFGGGGAVLSLDPDAAAYIAALETAGATVSPTQSAAIDAFVVAEKAGGRWASIKRLYLPIWAAATPNAICMRSLTSGTWVNSPTMGAGYVQGNGTSQYFDFGVSPATLGITNTSGFIGSLIKTADTREAFAFPIGARGALNSGQVSSHQNNSFTGAIGWVGRSSGEFSSPLTVAAVNGVLLSNRNASGVKTIQRTASGVIRSAANTAVATDAITTQNIYGLAINTNGAVLGATDKEIGALFAGVGIATDAGVDAYTANLKTLWETCTGLTLP